MSRRITLGTAIALAMLFGILTAVMTLLFFMNSQNASLHNFQSRAGLYGKIDEIDKFVRDNYLGAMDEAAVSDYMARGYMAGIGDAYAMYLTAEQYQRVMTSYDGQTANIGIEVRAEPSGYIQVLAVYPDSPAEAQGIRTGDLIVEVDDIAVTAEAYEAAVTALQGESGTVVRLTLRRAGEEYNVEITRRRIEAPSVEYRVIAHIGYIRIKEFNDNTPAQFQRALERLEAQQVTALCFDVRDNPGGTLTAVTEILDMLLPEGDLVSATYRSGLTEVLATSDAAEIDMPMAVLMNAKSASSAELFAQALKDYNKARTVGVTTFGKGMMQTIHRLSDGSAVELTIARYNPPRSANFDGVGVKPDYEIRLTADQERVLFQMDENTDPQMRKAMEYLGLHTPEADLSHEIEIEYEVIEADPEEPEADADSEAVDASGADAEGEPDAESDADPSAEEGADTPA